MINRFGEESGKLGFGLMRLPRLESGEFDKEQIKQMIDTFLDAGFTYFDTAFVYPGSEEVMKECLMKTTQSMKNTGSGNSSNRKRRKEKSVTWDSRSTVRRSCWKNC